MGLHVFRVRGRYGVGGIVGDEHGHVLGELEMSLEGNVRSAKIVET